MERAKLAIVCTHPIQYYAPVFRKHAESQDVLPRVFYTWSQARHGPVYDPDFGTQVSWDIPLLEGYDHTFVENTAQNPTSSRFFGIKTPGLAREITEWGADAVLVYGWNNHSHLNALRHFHGRVPVLFRGDSTLLDPLPPLRRLARRAYLRWVYAHVDMAIAVGQNSRDYFLWCGLSQERIAHAPHSVDTARFADPQGRHIQRANQLRQTLGIPAEARVLVFAGKFTAKKDPLLLLEAFAQLGAGSHLVFVGSGELEARLRERAAVVPGVHFLPFQNQSDMPAVYRLGDIFVMPSRGPGETWGLAMNEAMASGRAVIAGSRVGGARDMIVNGVTGWIFRSGDGRELCDVLRATLALDRGALLRHGETAQSASERWSTEAAATGIEDATLRALSRAASPRAMLS
jgi:glycosyltransferase involved in cell wall biosynthesis